MTQNVKPVFLISLPRSGSTLLQKMLMAHPEIDSCAEPWIMLPLIYSTKRVGIESEYGQRSTSIAVQSFIDAIGGGASVQCRDERFCVAPTE